MSDHQFPKNIDLLNTVLAAYREVDPPVGLETRILGTLEEKLRRPRFGMRFLLAATAGATGLGLALLLLAPTTRVPVSEPTIATVPMEQTQDVPSGSTAVRVSPPAATVTVKPKGEAARVAPRIEDAAAPRQSTFPAPSAPSEQERALISLMRSRRQILMAMSQSRPLEIKGDIVIVPIEPDPLVGEGERR